MAYADDAQEVRAAGWRRVAELHARVDRESETALRAESGLSVVEYTLLDVMHRQRGRDHLRMRQVARATALSESATTRLVDRLEGRGLLARYLCADDRRGIYAELTDAGRAMLERSRHVYEAAVDQALDDAQGIPELASVVEALRPVLTGREAPAGEHVLDHAAGEHSAGRSFASIRTPIRTRHNTDDGNEKGVFHE